MKNPESRRKINPLIVHNVNPLLPKSNKCGVTDGGAERHSSGARGPQRRRADLSRERTRPVTVPGLQCISANPRIQCAVKVPGRLCKRGNRAPGRKRVASLEVAQASRRALLRAPTPWTAPANQTSHPTSSLGKDHLTHTNNLLCPNRPTSSNEKQTATESNRGEGDTRVDRHIQSDRIVVTGELTRVSETQEIKK
ncbi:unnamed protein product [Colias eurytheme]|nr:unnamed protein product [Colias eurytheme]